MKCLLNIFVLWLLFEFMGCHKEEPSNTIECSSAQITIDFISDDIIYKDCTFVVNQIPRIDLEIAASMNLNFKTNDIFRITGSGNLSALTESRCLYVLHNNKDNIYGITSIYNLIVYGNFDFDGQIFAFRINNVGLNAINVPLTLDIEAGELDTNFTFNPSEHIAYLDPQFDLHVINDSYADITIRNNGVKNIYVVYGTNQYYGAFPFFSEFRLDSLMRFTIDHSATPIKFYLFTF